MTDHYAWGFGNVSSQGIPEIRPQAAATYGSASAFPSSSYATPNGQRITNGIFGSSPMQQPSFESHTLHQSPTTALFGSPTSPLVPTSTVSTTNQPPTSAPVAHVSNGTPLSPLASPVAAPKLVPVQNRANAPTGSWESPLFKEYSDAVAKRRPDFNALWYNAIAIAVAVYLWLMGWLDYIDVILLHRFPQYSPSAVTYTVLALLIPPILTIIKTLQRAFHRPPSYEYWLASRSAALPAAPQLPPPPRYERIAPNARPLTAPLDVDGLADVMAGLSTGPARSVTGTQTSQAVAGASSSSAVVGKAGMLGNGGMAGGVFGMARQTQTGVGGGMLTVVNGRAGGAVSAYGGRSGGGTADMDLDGPIRSSHSVDRLLAIPQTNVSPRQVTYAPAPAPPMHSAVSLPTKYHPSSPTNLGGGLDAPQDIAGVQYRHRDRRGAMREMGVDDVMVDSWVEEMRKWLHSKIFQPLTILLDNTDAYLRSQGLLHLTSSNAIWSDANPASLSALIREAQTPPQASLVGGPRPFAGAGSIFTPAPAPQMTMPQDLKGLSDVAKVMVGETKAIILTRLRLEAYLNVGKVGSPKNRAYVRERIFELSRNTYLSGYRWDSGGSFEGQEWDVKGEFPTDAKLVFHLFQTFMDQWSDVAQSGFPYFSTNHVIPSNAKLDPNSRSVYLREQNASPPHYQLLVQGCTWDMAQGSRNIFETISAFVCVIGRDAGWRVGDLDLKRKDLGIAKVVKGGLGAENAMW